MNFESTVSNLVTLINTVGVLHVDQIHRFFAAACDAKNIDFYLQQLDKDNQIEIDPEKKLVYKHKAPKLREIPLRDLIKAFWVIANFTDERVREVQLMLFPYMFWFSTYDGEVYDIALCKIEAEAQQAYKIRKNSLAIGAEDKENHILMVNSIELGESCRPYEFDSYCMLDSNNLPVYYQWN